MAPRLRDRRGKAAAPSITSPMLALAWSILHCPDQNGEDAWVLAKLVLEAAGGES